MVTADTASVGTASSTALNRPHPFATSSTKQVKPKAEITRAQIAQRIANGETLVLRGRAIYKLDAWLAKHPGGQLAILHFVGRDASDEIEVYHSEDTLRRMQHFQIGVLAELEYLGKQREDGSYEGYRPLVPPIQLGYRNGKLEHPDAHDELWQRQKEGVHREQDEVNLSSSKDVTTTATSNSSKTLDREDSPPSDCSSRASDSGYSDGDTSANTSISDLKEEEVKTSPSSTTKPLTMPLPVSLLEPPPDPPGIDAARERQISHAFKQLHEDVRTSGLYELHPSGYARELARYIALAATSFALWYYAQGRSSYYIGSAFFLGLFWHQLTFTAHDAGHSGITHNHAVDRISAIFIADYLGGLSIGWWCSSHDVHHLVTNHPEHDPDIQHLPFLAVSPRFLVSKKEGDDEGQDDAGKKQSSQTLGLWSSYYRRVLEFDAAARFFLQFQNQYYYFVMSLGRFNLYLESYGFLITMSKRNHLFWMECIGIVFFWSWFGSLVASLPSWKMRVAYILISHMVTSPLHVQIVLSHFAQSSEDLGLTESFVSRQLRTTMDVACPTYLDFVHGGLHMQVSHHLFPRLPRHNLRECRDRFVRPFAEKWGVEYTEYSFTEGNKKVLGVLKDVADQVKILGKVAAAQARGEIHAH